MRWSSNKARRGYASRKPSHLSERRLRRRIARAKTPVRQQYPARPRLTPAEKRIGTLLLQGLDQGEMAKILNIKRSGVKFHFRNMFRKFSIPPIFHQNVRLALLLHQHRREYGIPCQACGET